jgi:hypothetical protein
VLTPLQAGWTFFVVVATPAAVVTLLWEALVIIPGAGLRFIHNRIWFRSQCCTNNCRTQAAADPDPSATWVIDVAAGMVCANMIAGNAGLFLYRNLCGIWDRNRTPSCHARSELLALSRIAAGIGQTYRPENLPVLLSATFLTSDVITGGPRFACTDITGGKVLRHIQLSMPQHFSSGSQSSAIQYFSVGDSLGLAYSDLTSCQIDLEILICPSGRENA